MNQAGFCLLFLLISPLTWGQQNTIAAMAEAKTAEGSVSFTVGQVVYSSYMAGDVVVTEGVQQVWQLQPTRTGLADIKHTMQVCVFPNPASDYVYLTSKGAVNANYRYTIIDANGQSKQSGSFIEFPYKLNLTALSGSMYMVSVYRGNELITTFRLIKTTP